jgi:uncharacterized protein YdeI (YjbR/CyaY-like superfamily)
VATYFASADELRAWLAEHHASEDELLVGFWRVGSGRPSTTWAEAVDQALCYGWIDGVRRRVDDRRYTIRFTPRRRGSTWSNVNVANVERLLAAGLMAPAGIAAWEARDPAKTGIYSAESPIPLSAEYEAALRERPGAWEFWERQAPSYRRMASHWVMSAKQEQTRQRRLARLVDDSAAGRRI